MADMVMQTSLEKEAVVLFRVFQEELFASPFRRIGDTGEIELAFLAECIW